MLQTGNCWYGLRARSSQQWSYRSFSTEWRHGYFRQNRGISNTQNIKKKGKNPLDQYGNVTTCLDCNSVNHWLNNFPDKVQKDKPRQTFFQKCDEYEYEDDDSFKIALFQSYHDEPHHLKSLQLPSYIALSILYLEKSNYEL